MEVINQGIALHQDCNQLEECCKYHQLILNSTDIKIVHIRGLRRILANSIYAHRAFCIWPRTQVARNSYNSKLVTACAYATKPID